QRGVAPPRTRRCPASRCRARRRRAEDEGSRPPRPRRSERPRRPRIPPPRGSAAQSSGTTDGRRRSPPFWRPPTPRTWSDLSVEVVERVGDPEPPSRPGPDTDLLAVGIDADAEPALGNGREHQDPNDALGAVRNLVPAVGAWEEAHDVTFRELVLTLRV